MSRPNLLPPDPSMFINRTEPLRRIWSIVADVRTSERPALMVVTGPPGIGKTTLALHAAHRLAPQFPHGQYCYSLGGSTPGGPVDPADVLAHWLHVSGFDGPIPPGLAQRSALFRSRTYGQRILVVLDDAHHPQQVLPLLPSAPYAVVLVTSQQRYDGYFFDPSFQEIEVGAFTTAASTELLAGSIGQSMLDAEPQAAASLVAVCGGLPLAVSLAAAGVRKRRGRTLRQFIDAVDARVTLAQFHLDGDSLIEALFDVCYHRLDSEAAEAYRLLSLHPGPSFDVGLATAMLDRPAAHVERLLDAVVDVSLLETSDGMRYQFLTLIGAHARIRAFEDSDERRRLDATTAAVRHYLHFAAGRANVLYPDRRLTGDVFQRIPAAYTATNRVGGPDPVALALADLKREHLNLRAAALDAYRLELDDECVQLCEALRPWLYDTDRTADLIDIMTAGVRAADRTGAPEIRRMMQHNLGIAYEKLHDIDHADDALAAFRRSQSLAEQLGDRHATASAIEWQGLVHEWRNDPDAALQAFAAAWQIVDASVADPAIRLRWFALLRMHIARNLLASGRADEALDPAAEAVTFFTQRPTERVNTARAHHVLGAVLTALDRRHDAVAPLLLAEQRLTGLGPHSEEYKVLTLLADVHLALGDRGAAGAWLRTALNRAEQLGLVVEQDALAQRLVELRPRT